MKIDYDTEENPGGLKSLTAIQTEVKDYQLKLVWKTRKKGSNDDNNNNNNNQLGSVQEIEIWPYYQVTYTNQNPYWRMRPSKFSGILKYKQII